MKRKIMTLLLAAVTALTLSVPAFADVMWEPYGNSFYENHRGECTYVDRSFLAKGKKGYITVKTAPNSLVEVANMENGSTFRVVQTWAEDDGTQWGVGYSGRDIEGWVCLDELALIYDYIAFDEDHSAQFMPYDGSGDALAEVCLYSYPGGAYQYNLKENKDYMPFSESFKSLYTDENGLRWTFVGYYMGRNYAWACIDDPLNEKLGTDGYLTVDQVRGGGEVIPPVEELPQEGELSTEPSAELIPPAEKVPAARTWIVWLVPVALVLAVAVVTAVMIRRKNRRAK